MESEYHIHCATLPKEQVRELLKRLPSPIHRPELREIYNYRIGDNFIYFVDRGIDPTVAGEAFKYFVDAALRSTSPVTITQAKAQAGAPPPR